MTITNFNGNLYVHHDNIPTATPRKPKMVNI